MTHPTSYFGQFGFPARLPADRIKPTLAILAAAGLAVVMVAAAIVPVRAQAGGDGFHAGISPPGGEFPRPILQGHVAASDSMRSAHASARSIRTFLNCR